MIIIPARERERGWVWVPSNRVLNPGIRGAEILVLNRFRFHLKQRGYSIASWGRSNFLSLWNQLPCGFRFETRALFLLNVVETQGVAAIVVGGGSGAVVKR